MIRFLDQNLQLDISVSETNIKLRNVTSVTCELHNTRSRAIVPPHLNQLISTLCELPLAIPTTHLLVTTTFLRVAPTLYYQVVVHNMTHVCHVSSMCLSCLPCVFHVSAVSAMCLPCVCCGCHVSAICLPCVCHVSAMCLPCLSRVCPVSPVFAMCLQCVYCI